MSIIFKVTLSELNYFKSLRNTRNNRHTDKSGEICLFLIAMIYHRTWVISYISNLSYKQRLQCLKLDTLELRRLYLDMRMVYKIIHGLIDVAFDDLFIFSPNRSTRGHAYKLYCSKSNLNVRSHFFSQSCITAWNSLSNEVVTSPSLSIFNSRLHNVNFEKFLII